MYRRYISFNIQVMEYIGIKTKIKELKSQGFEVQYIVNCLLSSKEQEYYNQYKADQRLRRKGLKA